MPIQASAIVGALTDVSTTPTHTLGAKHFDGTNWYQYVALINDTASVTVAGVAGNPVAWLLSTNSAGAGVSTYTVTLDQTSADAQPVTAGFLMGTVTGTYNTTYYCWIQKTGLVTVPAAVASGVIGSGCMMSATDKTLTIATGVIDSVATLVTATAANNKVLAFCP